MKASEPWNLMILMILIGEIWKPFCTIERLLFKILSLFLSGLEILSYKRIRSQYCFWLRSFSDYKRDPCGLVFLGLTYKNTRSDDAPNFAYPNNTYGCSTDFPQDLLIASSHLAKKSSYPYTPNWNIRKPSMRIKRKKDSCIDHSKNQPIRISLLESTAAMWTVHVLRRGWCRLQYSLHSCSGWNSSQSFTA